MPTSETMTDAQTLDRIIGEICPRNTITMRSTKAEIFAAYQAATKVKPHRPIERMALAQLMICSTPSELARWVIDRVSAKACFGGDEHAGETMEAMHLFLSAEKLLSGGDSS